MNRRKRNDGGKDFSTRRGIESASHGLFTRVSFSVTGRISRRIPCAGQPGVQSSVISIHLLLSFDSDHVRKPSELGALIKPVRPLRS